VLLLWPEVASVAGEPRRMLGWSLLCRLCSSPPWSSSASESSRDGCVTPPRSHRWPPHGRRWPEPSRRAPAPASPLWSRSGTGGRREEGRRREKGRVGPACHSLAVDPAPATAFKWKRIPRECIFPFWKAYSLECVFCFSSQVPDCRDLFYRLVPELRLAITFCSLLQMR
jgi:hypothetical protein